MREYAFEHDLHLGALAQSLDRIPRQVRDVQAGGIADVNAVEIRSSGDIVPNTAAVAIVALPCIGAAQPSKRFPIRGRTAVDRKDSHERSSPLRAVKKGLGDLPFARIQLEPYGR